MDGDHDADVPAWQFAVKTILLSSRMSVGHLAGPTPFALGHMPWTDSTLSDWAGSGQVPPWLAWNMRCGARQALMLAGWQPQKSQGDERSTLGDVTQGLQIKSIATSKLGTSLQPAEHTLASSEVSQHL